MVEHSALTKNGAVIQMILQCRCALCNDMVMQWCAISVQMGCKFRKRRAVVNKDDFIFAPTWHDCCV